jgi:hypothetical protein
MIEITLTLPWVAGPYGNAPEHVVTIALPDYFRDLTGAELRKILLAAFCGNTHLRDDPIGEELGIVFGCPRGRTFVENDRDAVLSLAIRRLHEHCTARTSQPSTPMARLRRFLHPGATPLS